MRLAKDNYLVSDRHTTFYLESGPENGPVVYLLHGWPELSLSWRHQIECLGGLGFRVIAPDMRGYGRSSVYLTHDAYSQSEVVADMVELHDHVGKGPAVWIGHDWGSSVVWNMGKHHPENVLGIGSLCVPLGLEAGVDSVIQYVDREIYPEDSFPKGQWDYQYFYQENFSESVKQMDSDPESVIRLLFRKGSAKHIGKPAGFAYIRARGGFFPDGVIPKLPTDYDVISERDISVYASSLAKNGFFGPNSWYMNHDSNAALSASLDADWKLDMPVLFIHAEFDVVCETTTSKLAEPMRERCAQLFEVYVKSGHWVAQEKPIEVNSAIVRWLANCANYWPDQKSSK